MEKIPQPKRLPLLNNLLSIDTNNPVQSITKMANNYNGIFKLDFFQVPLVIVCSQKLVNEVCDEKRFEKRVHLSIKHLRPLGGNGLFTAETADPEWSEAHRILIPPFGPASLRNLFPSMLDIAEQMFSKWEQLGEKNFIDVADNMTRLTLDTIALASFNYRFNSFKSEPMHPFVSAMLRSLHESGARAMRPPFLTNILFPKKRTFNRDNRFMHELAQELIEERKNQGDSSEKRDLLHFMLNSEDSVTGKKLSQKNIIYQMVTFLIAGHETTSGLLSFTIYELLKNPEVLERLRNEVDTVLGSRTPTYEDLHKLTYLDQVFKETLRLWPTAPAFALQPLEESTIIGGKYQINRSSGLMILLPALHRDPQVWENPEKFDPDRMVLEKFRLLPPNSWKPWGNGKRSCIGRGFALQEASLTIAMMIQRFNIKFIDPDYKLKIKETLTIKPQGLQITVQRR